PLRSPSQTPKILVFSVPPRLRGEYIALYAETGSAFSTSNPAFCQSANPPFTLITLFMPARCSRLLAITLRYPLAQCTANGTSGSTSGGDTLNLSSGHQVAPAMCPACHSGSRRTSSTAIFPERNRCSNSCTVISGSDATGNPAR